jgi:hypothetical protein
VIDSITEGVAAETDGSVSRIPLRIDVWKLWKDPPNFFGRPAPALRELLSIGTHLWYHDTTQMTGGAKP